MVRLLRISPLVNGYCVHECVRHRPHRSQCAAEAGRFAEGDLELILDHRRLMGDRAGERLEPDDDTLQPGTGAWEDLGR